MRASAVKWPLQVTTYRLGLSLLASLWLACSSWSQDAPDAAALYEQANNYAKRFSGLIDRDSVALRFFGPAESYAWYDVRIDASEHQFVLIDGMRRERIPLFTSSEITAQLKELLTDQSPPERLRIGSLSFSDNLQTVYFRAADLDWQWDRESRSLSRAQDEVRSPNAPTGIAPLNQLGPSINGDPTEIEIRNELSERLAVFWVDNSGGRRPYGHVDPGQSFQSSTYEGHVWVLVDGSGRDVAGYRAERVERLAVVDATTPAPSPLRRRNRERSSDSQRTSAVSPDRQWRVDFRDHNIQLVDQKTKQRRIITSAGTERNEFAGRVWWSPDSNYFVVLRTERVEPRQVTLVEAAPEGRLQPRVKTINYPKPGDPLDRPRPYLFTVADLVELPTINNSEVSDDAAPLESADASPFLIDDSLFPNPYALNDFQWRDDSSEFTFLYNQRGHQVLRLIGIDPQTRHPRAIIDESSDTFVCYSQKLFCRRLEATDEIIWMTERDGWNHLVLVDWKTGEIKHKITSGEWVVRDVEEVDTEQRQLWLSVGGIDPGQDPYHQHLIRVSFDGRQLVRLTEGDGDHRWTYSPSRRWLIDTYSRVDLPPITVLRDADSGEEVCELERADWSRLLAAGWRAPERFVAKGRDGQTDIYGMIIRPTNFTPSKKYPILEAIYAGPHSSFTPKSFGLHHGLYEMAEMGFIVVKLDGMGTSNRSKAFHDVCWKNLGDSGFPDRIAWMKAAAESRPEMDLSRIGIWGGSAGGQSALRALLAYGDFYHAAAADCGCHDNRMDKIWWNEQWMGWPIGSHYEEQSNVTQAHRLEGKLLLTVGALDSNVDPSSTMQVVEALIQADKDFELIVFPSSNHGAGSSRYGVRRMQDFFLRSLGQPSLQETASP